MDSLKSQPPASQSKFAFLSKLSRMFADPGSLEISFDPLTAPETPSTLQDMSSAPQDAAEPTGEILDRLSFASTPDAYVVRLAAPGLEKSALKITVMRSSATILAARATKVRREGNVIHLAQKDPSSRRCQLHFADTVTRSGHTAKLEDGVLTLEFRKEKGNQAQWSELVEIG